MVAGAGREVLGSNLIPGLVSNLNHQHVTVQYHQAPDNKSESLRSFRWDFIN